MKKTVHIWTDGSTYPENPGSGGWGAVMECVLNGERQVLHVNGTLGSKITNNQAETRAVIESLKLIKLPTAIAIIYTDSRYVVLGIQKLQKILSTGKGKMPKANIELWEELLTLLRNRRIHIRVNKVKGHADIKNNELADQLAYFAAAEEKLIEERFYTDP